ncbi:hypothetical protein HHI36_012667 [Cryptolaemus montrouzieri]|uniref:Uncharacterized protein n=1 Tax=Cryptolaemus montrouzieri TaxID=559131 RepID=A0ABD2NGA8_9CUCU
MWCAENHASATHWLDLSHHLVDLGKEISLSIASLNDIAKSRRNRGLLGEFLTSVFGVNYVVYRAIDALKENQERLIEITNRQSKLMVSGKAAIEETEKRINRKLESFHSKINHCVKAIGEMAKWFKISDTNQDHIDVLISFQLAKNYLEENAAKYRKIASVCYHKSHITDFLAPAEISKIVRTVSRNLPATLMVLSKPIQKMEIEQDDQFIKIYALLHIIENDKFEVIKTTAVPMKKQNGTFVGIQVSTSFLAVHYDT